MIQNLIDQRNIPELMNGKPWAERREELLRILAENEYGYRPDAACEMRVRLVEQDTEAGIFAGKCSYRKYEVTLTSELGTCTFPYLLFLPKTGGKKPVFVSLSFHPEMAHKYCPTEEILDRGFGLAQVCYTQVVNDNTHGDFSDGMGTWVSPSGRARSEWGKITMWGYAASKVVDHLLTMPEVDENRLIVIGHSRLGKTALWCGALDERFAIVISNDSGAGGAALYRGKTGETISDFSDPKKNGFWDWFCEGLKDYYGKDGTQPFDQHMLLALVAPRRLLVGTAAQDQWADPVSEYLSCKAASPAWECRNLPGLVSPDRLPEAGDVFHEGYIGFHLRAGTHYLSREDWNRYMDYVEKHLG